MSANEGRAWPMRNWGHAGRHANRCETCLTARKHGWHAWKHELEPHESAALLQRRSSCAGRHAEPDRSDDFLVALAGALEEHSDTVRGTIIFNLNISEGMKVLTEHLPASSTMCQTFVFSEHEWSRAYFSTKQNDFQRA